MILGLDQYIDILRGSRFVAITIDAVGSHENKANLLFLQELDDFFWLQHGRSWPVEPPQSSAYCFRQAHGLEMPLVGGRALDCRNHAYFSASAPPMTSAFSFVICACRARLYLLVKLLIISPAFSVAAFMATRRAICSLTAASRKHLKSRILNDTGRISSRMSLALGRNSYSTLTAGALASTTAVGIGASGKSVSTVGTWRAALMNLE